MEGLEGLGMQEIGEVIPSFVAQRATVLKAIDAVKTRRDKKGRLWPDGDSLKIGWDRQIGDGNGVIRRVQKGN